MGFVGYLFMAGKSPKLCLSAKLNMILLNIDILEDAMKVTQRQLDSLNQRIQMELNHQPLNSLNGTIVEMLLTQHRKVIEQYNEENQQTQVLKRRFANEVEKGKHQGIISVDSKGISVMKSPNAK